MESLLRQIKELALATDDLNSRKEILDSIRDLGLSLETPSDTVQRLIYTPLQTVVAVIANDIKLFDIISEQKEPINIADLVEKTRASPLLLNRLLRYAAGMGMVKEVGNGIYTSTNITDNLIRPGLKHGLNFSVDIMIPTMQALPELLSDIEYKDTAEWTNTAFQRGLSTTDSPFVYLSKHPKKLGHFSQYMTASHDGLRTWLDVYPVLEETINFDTTKPLFVDIGSGIGHQALALKTKYPQFDQPGRLIIQDLAPVIEHSIPMENVTAMVYDFFTPQPIKDAKFYYMRNILHSYTDDKCRIILGHIKSAMGKDSVILIDEMAFPDTGVHWQASQLDLLMMMAFGGIERTITQWHTLLDSAGLKILKTHRLTEFLTDSVLVAAPI